MSAAQGQLALHPPSKLSSVRLINGDCLEVMPTLPKQSVHLLFCDLPYSITHHAYDVAVHLPAFLQIALSLSAPRSAVICTATMLFAHELLSHFGKLFRHDLIWHKSRSVGFLTAKKMPMKAHEHILVFSANGFTYNPQMVDAGKPCVFAPDDRVGIPVRVAPSKIVYKKNVSNFRYPTSVQSFKSVANRKRLHPAQKPLDLLRWLVATYTSPGDTVLDPTMGSGGMGVACLQMGRHFVGIEKDPKYFRIGSERIAAEQERLKHETP